MNERVDNDDASGTTIYSIGEGQIVIKGSPDFRRKALAAFRRLVTRAPKIRAAVRTIASSGQRTTIVEFTPNASGVSEIRMLKQVHTATHSARLSPAPSDADASGLRGPALGGIAVASVSAEARAEIEVELADEAPEDDELAEDQTNA